MINIEKDTPVEYSKQSRDYQVFSFIYTILFNYTKMYVDLVKNVWTDNIDSKLLDLRAYTLNFIPKFQWDNSDLLGVTNCFRYLLRTKGTKNAIQSCLEILARVRGITLTGLSVQITEDNLVQLILNEDVADVGNIEDLLRYILPAGTTYEIIKYSRLNSTVKPTEIVVDNVVYMADGKNEYQSNEFVIPNKDTPEDQLVPERMSNSMVNRHISSIITDGTEADAPYEGD